MDQNDRSVNETEEICADFNSILPKCSGRSVGPISGWISVPTLMIWHKRWVVLWNADNHWANMRRANMGVCEKITGISFSALQTLFFYARFVYRPLHRYLLQLAVKWKNSQICGPRSMLLLRKNSSERNLLYNFKPIILLNAYIKKMAKLLVIMWGASCCETGWIRTNRRRSKRGAISNKRALPHALHSI